MCFWRYYAINFGDEEKDIIILQWRSEICNYLAIFRIVWKYLQYFWR